MSREPGVGGRRIRVCHIITLLELGGAQQNTLHTVANLDRNRFEPILVAGRGGFLDGEAGRIPGLQTLFLPDLVREVPDLDGDHLPDLDEDHFALIPGLGRALKFTFTLYDSRGLIKKGRTFTHIVYLDK